ncbi:MAG TPA: hypothetical protein VKN36_16565, partial [Eudoraea sp.]|nr:hypothetical protein [Eudoraea sp.]
MKNSVVLSILLTVILAFNGFPQQVPAPAQNEAVTITGATAHIGDGSIIENCSLVFEGGKITALGSEVTSKGTIINAVGKHLYPGFIAPGKSLGLIEVNAVRASNDQDEIGLLIPHVRSIIAYNAESKVVESMRPNGVLLGQVTPKGGRISGTSSIVQFDAWNWEDAAVKLDDGIHLNWPMFLKQGNVSHGESKGYHPDKDYAKNTAEIESFMKHSLAYGKVEPREINPAFAAMQGVFDGSQNLYVYAHGEREIIDAVTALKKAGVKNLVLVGGYQSYKITDFLMDNNIPVLVEFTHSLPVF